MKPLTHAQLTTLAERSFRMLAGAIRENEKLIRQIEEKAE